MARSWMQDWSRTFTLNAAHSGAGVRSAGYRSEWAATDHRIVNHNCQVSGHSLRDRGVAERIQVQAIFGPFAPKVTDYSGGTAG